MRSKPLPSSALGRGFGEVKGGGILVETYNGNYKEAAKLAFVNERVVKILDPKTKDQEAAKVIGQETGQALVIVATHKVGAPKGPAVPGPAAPPPARVVVAPPMSAAQQVAKTQPAAAAPKTIRDVTGPTNPNSRYGLERRVAKRVGEA